MNIMCRSFLSPWFPEGGLEPVYVGRFNIGVVSLNLPMIYMKAKTEGKDFYKELDYYLQMIRGIHLRTREYISNMKASCNPIGFMEGGFLGGHLQANDKIAPVVKSATASFGITALNELNILAIGKTLVEDNSFAKEVMTYINEYLNKIKHIDKIGYGVYGTPAESLCGYQLKYFVEKYGIIPGVSDRDYFSNSFHCHVTEKITPIEKQDKEYELFHMFNGGHIQYVRVDNPHANPDAIKSLVRRGMDRGYYQGINFDACFCENCGNKFTGSIQCPKCGSTEVTVIDRVCGYLGYSKIHGTSRMNASKTREIQERVSM